MSISLEQLKPLVALIDQRTSLYPLTLAYINAADHFAIFATELLDELSEDRFLTAMQFDDYLDLAADLIVMYLVKTQQLRR